MKLFKQSTHQATNWGCLIVLAYIVLFWILVIVTIVHYISEPFSKSEKVKQLSIVKSAPVAVINTTVESQYIDIPLSHEYQDYVVSELKNYPYVTKELAYAVMEKESNFDFNAVGQAGEQGIFQIHPINFGWLKEQGIDIHDPKQNIKAGLLMLNYFIGKQSDIEMGLMCYNAGESKLKHFLDKEYSIANIQGKL